MKLEDLNMHAAGAAVLRKFYQSIRTNTNSLLEYLDNVRRSRDPRQRLMFKLDLHLFPQSLQAEVVYTLEPYRYQTCSKSKARSSISTVLACAALNLVIYARLHVLSYLCGPTLGSSHHS